MRINFRIVKSFAQKKYTFFAMLSTTQTLNGITSKTKNGKHYLFFDLENTTLGEIRYHLGEIQDMFQLSNIYICSDKEGSYRAYCFNEVTFYKWIQIITTLPEKIVDFNFLHWSIVRGKATLRTSNKIGRTKQKCVSVLKSYYLPIPKEIEFIQYDTGINKRGINILLGE